MDLSLLTDAASSTKAGENQCRGSEVSCTFPHSLASRDGLSSTWCFAPSVELKAGIKMPLAFLPTAPWLLFRARAGAKCSHAAPTVLRWRSESPGGSLPQKRDKGSSSERCIGLSPAQARPSRKPGQGTPALILSEDGVPTLCTCTWSVSSRCLLIWFGFGFGPWWKLTVWIRGRLGNGFFREMVDVCDKCVLGYGRERGGKAAMS